ncbi:MAG: hypothetical protein ACXAEN_19185 [Candidatus Thorarchaeota archaeon]|jgi:hypothetical protein
MNPVGNHISEAVVVSRLANRIQYTMLAGKPTDDDLDLQKELTSSLHKASLELEHAVEIMRKMGY